MINELFNDTDFPDLVLHEPGLVYITPAEEELIKILPSELKALNARLEFLEKGMSAQSLMLEVERAKRQRLSIALKTIRPDVPNPHYDNLQQIVENNAVHQNAINYQLQGDIDRHNTIMFRYLSRLQQLLSFILPNVAITSSDEPDTNQLLEEMGRVLSQLCVPRQTSTIVWQSLFLNLFNLLYY